MYRLLSLTMPIHEIMNAIPVAIMKIHGAVAKWRSSARPTNNARTTGATIQADTFAKRVIAETIGFGVDPSIIGMTIPKNAPEIKEVFLGVYLLLRLVVRI